MSAPPRWVYTLRRVIARLLLATGTAAALHRPRPAEDAPAEATILPFRPTESRDADPRNRKA